MISMMFLWKLQTLPLPPFLAFRQDFKAYPIVAEEDAKENTSAKKEAPLLERHLNLGIWCLGGGRFGAMVVF